MMLVVLAVAIALPGSPTHDVSAERPESQLECTWPVGDAEIIRVDVELGGDDVASTTTVKAEDRRLLLLGMRVPKGATQTASFLISTRHPAIPASEDRPATAVGLKGSEIGSRSWDDLLSLEFLGDHPRVRRVTFVAAESTAVTRVFIAGDSTVTDGPTEPFAGWGQMLPLFFGPQACVVNLARSGLTLDSFAGSRRLAKLLAELRPGDFVLVQFGHNDQKDSREGAGAFTTYADNLRRYVDAIRERGGRPVLVSPVGRRRFDAGGRVVESLGDFPEAMRRVAVEKNVPLIDLNRDSKRLYQALGVDGSRNAFVHGTFPGRGKPLSDDSHFSNYGAHQVARCAVESIRTGIPDLARLLRDDVTPFDPAAPQTPDALMIPPSPPPPVITPPEGR